MMFALGPLLNHNAAAMSGGAAAAWTPASALNSGTIVGWYDGDQQTEASSAAVATFVDRSGNSNDFTNSNATERPLLIFSAINGKKALQFDGSNDFLSTATGLLNGATSGAFFAVIQITADPPSSGQAAAVLNEFGTSGSDSHHPFTDGNIYDGFGSSVRKTVGNPTPSLASTALIGAVSATNDYRFYVNDTGTPLFSTATNTVAFGTATRLMGWSDNAAQFLSGLIAEVIVISGTPNSTDLANIKAYVNTKYGTSF